MFNLVLVNPTNSLTNSVIVEGMVITIPVSLPQEIISSHWEGEDLVLTVDDSLQDTEQKAAWCHSVQYIKELLQPQDIYEQHEVKADWVELFILQCSRNNISENTVEQALGFTFKQLHYVAFDKALELSRNSNSKIKVILGCVQAFLVY